jgi:hydroxyethylthiazole kinase-like uncharacterized protein yjeF
VVKGYSARQIREAEAPHLAAGEPLMARAAAALARECDRILSDAGLSPAHSRVVVLVGGGNNGGDALFAAATLATRGASVELIRTSSHVHEDGLRAALAAGAVELKAETVPAAKLAARAASADLIIDGILGTGTSDDPRLRGAARDIVAAMVARRVGRSSKAAVVAVDIPSGIHPDTGEVPDPDAVLRADATVTFGGVKAGLLLDPGKDFAGAVRLVDIGLAAELEGLTPLLELP